MPIATYPSETAFQTRKIVGWGLILSVWELIGWLWFANAMI